MNCNLKNIGPVNITSTTTTNTCDNTNCKLIYDFGLSRCGTTNKGTYIQIETDGTNTLKFGSLGKLTIAETRLYQPSLNKINNKVFDAEIVIQCITKNSNNFFICIPIEANDNGGTSNDWFSFLKNCPNTIDSSVDINRNNFTMNDLLPKGSFYYCKNLSMPWSCNTNDSLILFNKSATMNSELKPIMKAAISKHSYTIKPLNGRTTVFFNSTGTNEILGKENDNTMTCVPIGSDGEPLIASGESSGFLLKNKYGENIDKEKLKKKAKEQWQQMLLILWTFLGVIIVCILILIILYIANNFSGKSKAGNTST